MSEPPDDVVDALYGGEASAFVAARDAAVRELRAAGRREEATAVKALARPTVAAAGVNHAVRSGAVDALWTAGDALAQAQAALLSGDADAAALRAAKAGHEEALEQAVGVAGEGARETLRAASVDAGVRAEVSTGRLVKEVAPGADGGGFGGFGEPAPVRAGDGSSKAGGGRPKAARARAEAEAAEQARATARAEAAERAKEAAKARKALGQKLEKARARALRSAAAAESARRTADAAQASSTADADTVAALERDLAALDPT